MVKITRTVKVCYVLGAVMVTIGLAGIVYGVNKVEWEDPWTWHHLPYEDWTPQVKDWSKITLYPYRYLGLISLGFGASVFLLLPTLISQISEEVQQKH